MLNPEMAPKALARIEESLVSVQHRVLSGEALPMENDSFDFVVSTFTLCSIAKVEQAIGEMAGIATRWGVLFLRTWTLFRPIGGFLGKATQSYPTGTGGWLSSEPSDGADRSFSAIRGKANPDLLLRGSSSCNWLPLSRAGIQASLVSRKLPLLFNLQSVQKLSSRLAIGLQIQSQSISARSVTNPFRKALLFQIGQQIIPLGVIPGVVSSKPVIQFLLGKSFLWFEIHFSLLRRFKKLIESRD